MREPATKASFEVVTVSPELAAKYLERNVCNRKMSRAVVKRYAEEMARGEWQFNGETIKFDGEGRLIDGQHRLHAIVRAGVSVELGIFRSLKHSAFKTIDTGRNRTGGDVLSICGVAYPNETAAAARLLWLYLSKALDTRPSMTNGRLLGFLDEHPNLLDSVERAMKKPFAQKLLSKSQWGFGYYAACAIDRKLADRFFAELATGLYGDRKTSQAVYALRERLIAVAAEALPPSAQVKLGWLISAWNAFYAGKPLGRLSRFPGRAPRFDPEPFA